MVTTGKTSAESSSKLMARAYATDGAFGVVTFDLSPWLFSASPDELTALADAVLTEGGNGIAGPTLALADSEDGELRWLVNHVRTKSITDDSMGLLLEANVADIMTWLAEYRPAAVDAMPFLDVD